MEDPKSADDLRSIVVLAVPHPLQGPGFYGYIDDPSYSIMVKNWIEDGIDFVFEEAGGQGTSSRTSRRVNSRGRSLSGC